MYSWSHLCKIVLIWRQVQIGKADYLWMVEFGEILLSSRAYFSPLFALQFLKKKKKKAHILPL